MCSIGKGCIDYKEVFSAIRSCGYDGWITVEQERDPKNNSETLQDLLESNQFLSQCSLIIEK